jgi:hypothetical protein
MINFELLENQDARVYFLTNLVRPEIRSVGYFLSAIGMP